MDFEQDFRFIAQQLQSDEHQTLMFAATFPPAIQSMPKEVVTLVTSVRRRAEETLDTPAVILNEAYQGLSQAVRGGLYR
ncbi:hypothetical protein M514_08363 [Trichuris suis]|nr:hypothetical protein M514_08363 [Trichuris suis]